ncbi:MAG TPA: Wzz/FepE/Etk N-terminal domain-containing protein [Solirubrobacteraceae bacterium]|jgi:Mrp family chromosome partitioning ATPase|nr:Wzz/FepE/Etk N-terminal domain-containing protein [Solirubrobacteraceae bacterium]
MNETSDATAIFAPLWRRKWLILAVGIIVAAASYLYYKRQRPTYQATTQVFLGAGAEEQAPTERTANKGRGNALADQAAVINTIVVEQVRQQLTAEHKRALARGTKVKAKSNEKSEFISITTEAHSGKGAALLANLTAQTYVKRQKDKRRRGIEKAIAINRRQLRRIEQSAIAKDEQPAKKQSGSSSAASGAGSTSTSTSTTSTSTSPTSSSSTTSTTPAPARSNESASNVIQEANLSSKINQLESSLETASAQQVKPAKAGSSQLLSPKPRKDAIFGFVLGIVLAAIAAYAFSRFDRRLRSLSRIESAIGLPLLAALPKVRRPIVRGGQSPRPSVHLLEPLRRLQTALQLTDGARSETAPASRPRVVAFVSPDPGDGKSTLVADLALVLRDGGERVVIVEANFRRPVQDRLLGLEEQGGLAAALTGRLDVEEAMQRVAPALGAETSAEETGHAVATAVQARVGSLFLLAGDRSVPNPPTLLAQESTFELLRSLAEKFDYVLIDAPSPLEVSDVVPLLGAVDGIVVVARAGHSRDASAERLRELLAGPSRAPIVGLVANFVSSADLKRYGYSSLDGRSWPGAKLTGR